ncbi:MAG: VIT domain-containing protein, partial [Planctomycetota bacterium]
AAEWPVLPPPTIKLPPNEQPIRLDRCAMKAQVRGVVAEVTTTLVFANPNGRALAGELEFPLPDGATICGYALDVNEQMVDGVLVSRERARVVLETESRRGIDPGLVEHVRGNVFRTRIFPLPAHGKRTVMVTWAAPLAMTAKEAALRLPLPRALLPILDINVDIAAGGVVPEISGFGNLSLTKWENRHHAEAHLTNVTPGDDLLIRLPRLPKTITQIEERRGEHFAIICDDPQLEVLAAPAPRRLAVAWDASGSTTDAASTRGRNFLKSLLARFPGLTLDVVVFRDKPEAARTFTDAAALDAFLAATPRDGATGLAALDLSANGMPTRSDSGWLLISDGLGTWGGTLPTCGTVAVTCLVAEPIRDTAVLRLIAERSGGQVIDLTTATAENAVDLIAKPVVTLARVDAAAGVLADVHQEWLGGRAVVMAKILTDGDATLVYRRAGTEFARTVAHVRKADATAGTAVARAWAGAQAAELAISLDTNRSALLNLGRTYGIVTAGTSLLVLERLDQYLRHGVEPPASLPAMREQWATALKNRQGEFDQRRISQQDRLLSMWENRVAWWEGREPKVELQKDGRLGRAGGMFGAVAVDAATPSPRPAPTTVAPVTSLDVPSREDNTANRAPKSREEALADSEQGGSGAFMAVGAGEARAGAMGSRSGGGRRAVGAGGGGSGGGAPLGNITVTPFDPDSPYMRALKAAAPADAYAVYLREKEQRGNSPSFYLDCGSYLTAQNLALGLRVLSNLAEMRIDDPNLLRVLAWRLQDSGEIDAAIGVLRKILIQRPEEPQSYRDLALALALRWERSHGVGDAGEALVLLQRVFERRPLENLDLGERWTIDANWARFRCIEVTALEEFNRLVTRIGTAPSDKPVSIPAIDQRLARNLDCDLRVVMAWDADATDIDLHVIQPNSEEAFYGHNRTSTGGLVSDDVTQGYGPEEYLIRRAENGAYQIRCKFYGSRQQTLLGPATVTATVYLDWGRSTERSQRMTLRLDQRGDMIPVGTVNVGGSSPDSGKPGEPQTAATNVTRAQVLALAKGATRAQVESSLGSPARVDSGGVTALWYRLSDSGRWVRIGFGPELLWAREVLDGAERDMLGG